MSKDQIVDRTVPLDGFRLWSNNCQRNRPPFGVLLSINSGVYGALHNGNMVA